MVGPLRDSVAAVLHRSPTLRIALWALLGGVLIALLKVLDYRHFVHAYPTELYGGLIAALFAALGVYAGWRWSRDRETVVVREVRVPVEEFELDDANLKETGITPRELEILGLVAEGLSNRQIADRLAISESTVKTHAYRLFDKLYVRRRVQAVQRGRELGLIPWGARGGGDSGCEGRESYESLTTSPGRPR